MTVTTELYNNIYALLFPFTFSFGLNNYQDAVQDAFIKYMREEEEKRNTKAWFYIVVLRLLIKNDMAKNKQRAIIAQYKNTLNGLYYNPLSEDELMEDLIIANLWIIHLPTIPSGQKDVIEGWLNGESNEEIATRLGISATSVRVQKHNAIQNLRKKMLECEDSRKEKG